MLRGVYGELMPCRDPHMAGPALWALHRLTGEAFEVPVVPVEGTTPLRKRWEALAIALYRQGYGRSPIIGTRSRQPLLTVRDHYRQR
jgi:hypothetical protein